MTQTVRQSTQVVVRIGPFVDATDGVTPETGVTLGAADQAEALKAAGAATTDISAATWAAITGADGWYNLTLTTAHTDTIGTLDIVVQDASVCLPVHARFQVIEEAAYDTIYAASALPASTTNITAGTITTATNVTTVNGLAANVITAAATAADFGTEVASAVWDMDATAHQTQGTFGQAIGDPVADTNTIYKAVVTDATGATVGVDIVALQADEDDIQARLPAALVGGRIDASVGAMAANTMTAAATSADFVTEMQLGLSVLDQAAIRTAVGLASANLDTQLSTIDTVADGIKAKTDSLTFTVAGHVDVNLLKVNGATIVGNGSGTPFNV